MKWKLLAYLCILYPVNCQEYVNEEEEMCGPYGCCSQNATLPAFGPHDLGCCVTSEFGCCADHIQEASGPYQEGCPDCQESEFGCCPDETTPAQERYRKRNCHQNSTFY